MLCISALSGSLFNIRCIAAVNCNSGKAIIINYLFTAGVIWPKSQSVAVFALVMRRQHPHLTFCHWRSQKKSVLGVALLTQLNSTQLRFIENKKINVM